MAPIRAGYAQGGLVQHHHHSDRRDVRAQGGALRRRGPARGLCRLRQSAILGQMATSQRPFDRPVAARRRGRATVQYVARNPAAGKVSPLVADAAKRIVVGIPRLEHYVHGDIKPGNVLSGAGLTLPARTAPEDVVEAGLPASVVRDFAAASGISVADVGQIVGASVRTMARKLAKDERLGAAESDRAYRLFDAVARAVHSFGDVEKALRWLQRNIPSLGNRTPIELLRTEIGTREVLSAVDRISYGGVA